MPNFSNATLTSFTLNIVSSIAELITLSISLCFLFFIIYRFLHIKYRRGQVHVSTPIILSINTLCLLIVKNIIQLMDVNLNALRRDLNCVAERNDSFFCRLRGYTFFAVVSALYWSYALQAIFRFISVSYRRCSQLHRPTIHLYMLICGQTIFAFSSVLPHLLVFDGIRLISDEIYCTALMNDFPSLIYLFLMVFGLPLGIIVICYTCIIYKMRYSSFRLSYQRCNRRDYIVINRIMIIVGILSVASLPAIIDLIIYVPQNRLDPLIYRIEWVSASVNALICAISLPFVNPQLFELFKNRQAHKKPIIRLNVAEETIVIETLQSSSV